MKVLVEACVTTLYSIQLPDTYISVRSLSKSLGRHILSFYTSRNWNIYPNKIKLTNYQLLKLFWMLKIQAQSQPSNQKVSNVSMTPYISKKRFPILLRLIIFACPPHSYKCTSIFFFSSTSNYTQHMQGRIQLRHMRH